MKNDPSQLERLRGAAGVDCLEAARVPRPRARCARFARSLIGDSSPTVVVASNPYALMYASLALRSRGVRAPLAVTFHTTGCSTPRNGCRCSYYRPFFWSADAPVFVCETQRALLAAARRLRRAATR